MARLPALMLLLTVILGLCWSPRAARAVATDYTIAAVRVDVTAASAAEARDKALVDGQELAYRQLLDTYTLPEQRSRLPQPSPGLLDSLIERFSVADEKISPVRYTANLTFVFRGSAVRSMFGRAGVAMVPPLTTPVLVIPVLQQPAGPILWEPSNPWRRALAAAIQEGSAPLRMPRGDALDGATVDAAGAATGERIALASIGQHYGIADVVVAAAALDEPRPPAPRSATDAKPAPEAAAPPSVPGVTYTLTRYAGSATPRTAGRSVPAKPGETIDALLARAATLAVADVVDLARRGGQLTVSAQSATANVDVPVATIADWLEIRQRLTKVAAVRDVAVLSLAPREVRIRLQYDGNAEELGDALERADLTLTRDTQPWTLLAGAPSLQSALPPPSSNVAPRPLP